MNEDDLRDKVRAKIAASRNMTGKEPTPSYVASLLAEHGLPSGDAEVSSLLGKSKARAKGKGKAREPEAAPPESKPAPQPTQVASPSQQLVLVGCETDLPSITLERWIERAFAEGTLRFPGQPLVLQPGQEELVGLLTRLGAIVVRGTR